MPSAVKIAASHGRPRWHPAPGLGLNHASRSNGLSNRDKACGAVGGQPRGDSADSAAVWRRPSALSPSLNSQAASVGSTRRPISEPRLPWESCSLRDLGDQVSGLLPPTTFAPGGDSADRQSASIRILFAVDGDSTDRRRPGAKGGRFSAVPSRNFSADPAGSESSTGQTGTLLTEVGTLLIPQPR